MGDNTIEEVTAVIGDKTESVSKSVYEWVGTWGLPEWLETPLATLMLFVGVVALSLLLLVIIRPLLLRWVTKAIEKTPIQWDDYLLWNGVPRWASHFVCGLIILAIIPGLFADSPNLKLWLSNFAKIYMVIAGFFIFDAILNTGKGVYQRTEMSRKFPVTSFLQLSKTIGILVAIILAVSIVAGRSPLALIAGLGVMASVLMLVFKDPILGFVAGIQLAANKMIAPGDWIEMPKYNADGDVIDVGMTTVKIQNFDKTITTVPTQALISDSFKNWRSMQEAGGRRIKRCIHIDVRTIKICNDWLLKTCGEMQLITEFVDAKRKEVTEWNEENGADPVNKINGRQLTNLGMFRAYIEAYLEYNPEINHDLTMMVRQLQPTDLGMPLEIYCFTKTTNWGEYEAVQADLFDHLIVAAKEFELEIFQRPVKLDTETVVNMYGGRLDQAHAQ